MTTCLQYYYENPEDSDKYKINCEGKTFDNLENVELFNNKDLLEFVNEKYSEEAFPENSWNGTFINQSLNSELRVFFFTDPVFVIIRNVIGEQRSTFKHEMLTRRRRVYLRFPAE